MKPVVEVVVEGGGAGVVLGGKDREVHLLEHCLSSGMSEKEIERGRWES